MKNLLDKALLDKYNLGKQIILLDECNSTNTHAMNLIIDGKKDDFVLISKIQTSGRGRLNRVWESSEGESICMSAVSNIGLDVRNIESITIRVGLEICKQLNKEFKAYLKWPNDIYNSSGIKLSGMLAELLVSSSGYSLIFGIGLNYDNKNLKEYASYIQEGGVLDINELAIVLAESVYRAVEGLKNEENIAEEFAKYDWLNGKEIEVDIAELRHKGYAIGINEYGNLLLEKPSGGIEIINSGEATIIK